MVNYVCGRFHFTHYPIDDSPLLGSGFEVVDCNTHKEAYEKAFRMLINPNIKNNQLLEGYDITYKKNSKGFEEIIVSDKEGILKFRIYNPDKKSRKCLGEIYNEGVFLAKRNSCGERLLIEFFDILKTNIMVEEGNFREGYYREVRRF